MKVILLSTFYKPSVGGVERQVEEIYIKLKEKGIDTTVYTTDASHSTSKRLTDVSSEKDVVRFRYLFGFGYFFRFAPMLPIKLLFSDFDVIHVHNSHDAHILPVIFIKLIRRKKLVLTGHNPFVVDGSKRDVNLSAGVKFFDKVLKLFSFAIDKYVALLESEKQFVTDYLGIKPHKIEIIPNGIRNDYFDEIRELKPDNIFFTKYNINKEDYKLVVGCLCRMDFVKGIQNLLLAVQQNPDCLFIFAGGDGGYLTELKKIYKDCKNVLFTETFLDVNSSMDFYSFIDTFLLPSFYEPFGITLVEAMTQGKYILASRNGGPVEIIKQDFGKVVDPLDFEFWSNEIESIKNNKQAYIVKGKSAVTFSKIYTWEAVIVKLISLYKAI